MSEHAKRPVCPEARFPVERAYVPEVNKLKQYLHDLTEYADSLESQLSDQKAMNDEVIKHARELIDFELQAEFDDRIALAQSLGATGHAASTTEKAG